MPWGSLITSLETDSERIRPSLKLLVASRTPATWADGCHAITSSAATYEECVGAETENQHIRALSSVQHGRQLTGCDDAWVCRDVCMRASGTGFGYGLFIGLLVAFVLLLTMGIPLLVVCCGGKCCGVTRVTERPAEYTPSLQGGVGMQPLPRTYPAVAVEQVTPRFDPHTGARLA